MKNTIEKMMLISVLLGMLCLTACGQDAAAGNAAEAGNEGAESVLCESWNRTDKNLPVTMQTEYTTYLPDTQTINVDITNFTDSEFSYSGSKFTLYRLENGKEKEIPYKKDGDNFTAIAYICPPQGMSLFTADLASHYDLPLEEGVYFIRIGDVSEEGENRADFVISADAEYVQAEQTETSVSMNIVSADAENMTVSIQNDADAPYVFSKTQLSLEHTEEMSASCAAYAAEDVEIEIPPHGSTVLTLQAAEFGSGELLADGSYALMLDNIRAEFQIEGENVK